VTVLDRSEARLAALCERHGDAVRTQHGDVTDGASHEAAVKTAVEAFGGLDTLIANAGLWDFGRTFEQMTVEEVDRAFRELFDVNVKGYLLAARAALDELRRSHGSVILTLSNAAFYPMGGGVLYTASKHAGVGLVRQLAFELAPDVRVNAVAPGGMATELSGPAALGMDQQSIGATPVRDYLARYSALELAPEPEDYVAAYLLLASRRDSRATTGAVLDISSVGTPQRQHQAGS
jgi:2,3-dihydroxy-2,3-dihydrophenylpropionate dehydrogenase